VRWIAGPLSCGLASFVMTMTNTIHPPGGATALFAVIDPTVQAMGWIFIPLIILGSVLMFLVALIVNNIQRQFPVFWWTPRDVGRKSGDDIESFKMEEKLETAERIEYAGIREMIVLDAVRVIVPEGFVLDPEQVQVLEMLRDRLRDWNKDEEEEPRLSFESGSDKTQVGHGSGP
jgi:uncharacterized SAM-binding protein YcdF (DUF218 family)